MMTVQTGDEIKLAVERVISILSNWVELQVTLTDGAHASISIKHVADYQSATAQSNSFRLHLNHWCDLETDQKNGLALFILGHALQLYHKINRSWANRNLLVKA